ncbi:nucleotidyl transferase AbiEii/AbiGii toxin family protein [Granulicella sp. dw_53]|uniref:nucleotidyl transferase AbiEii/AbiGii toxin family protein n=1 Tax=Granulicella sp. dw_53 TaxID=2719792 RepID=UPI001BD46BA2|nr:nucleotidyl transferase AbiEii/AbiGii toxin family protein [Granulicella sp. dw_53]
MSVFSNQLFISPERPVDPVTLSILELIDRLLRDAKIRYMLVGATARDLLLYHVFGHAVTRATYDLDFAILVDSWEQFATVKQMFLEIPGFVDKGRSTQRLYYQPTGASFETIIDIIPFGKLETAERTIAWPPGADVVMNVAAFSDVFGNSLLVQVRPDLIIPVASLPGLMVLKLFAWLDRHEERDVQDIRRLIETYTDAGNVNRLYEEEADELERVGFDTTLAGAFLLGKDTQRITDENVRTRLSTLLSGKELPALVLQLTRTMSIFDDHTESAEALLRGFFRGMGFVDLL